MLHWMRPHVSDADLLLLAEGELDERRAARVRRHLRACGRCAARQAALPVALAALTRASAAAPAPQGDARAARAALLARLAEETAASERIGRGFAWAGLRWRSAPLAAAGLAVALLVLLAAGQFYRGPAPATSRVATAGPALPRPDLTPGAVRRVSVEEVCSTRAEAPLPPVAASVVRRVFENYGADFRRAADYELDFLITPELGGTADARNLWPQPYGATRWNAYVKDELEQHFQRLVCAGEIDLSTAQREMATDWISAYRRYFATDQPRPSIPDRGGRRG